MRHNRTLRRQSESGVERVEGLEDCGGTILYVDEQRFTRECIGRELARRLPEFTIIECASAQDLISNDLSLPTVALIILYVHADRMDLHANGDPDPSAIGTHLATLENCARDTPRVLMSEAEMPEGILEAFRRRIRGYVPTTLPIKQVAEAIRFVAAGGTFVPESILWLRERSQSMPEEPQAAAPSDDLATFSPRQNEVLRMLWNGSANKVIAYELKMSESTVKVHIRHIMKKLNVNNRTQVVLRTRPQQLGRSLAANAVASPARI